MSKFGLYNKFMTKEGKRDELVGILLEAAASMEQVTDCEIYSVNVSDNEPESVWVYEVWSSAGAHQASLSLEGAAALIGRAMPLIAGVERIHTLTPVGGKGIS
ncbi:putative quinol monooxygenase [Paenibacillus rigui]|uniref:Antibiotic biosynthesis monooxygenase n=1 Tax=Paenibacillus rigui TaxID=554312 RepID=A0A229UXD3_9BACL|nr:putative quinol monooxygenase [Paenibacillus rigui]OXM87599.1 antibiotic biosynthesis monooxygenase [Paenibacillus rigui]